MEQIIAPVENFFTYTLLCDCKKTLKQLKCYYRFLTMKAIVP